LLGKRFEEYLMLWARKQKVFPIPPTIDDYKNELPHPGRIEGGLRIYNKFERKTQSDKPLVSVITIVRNGAKTLEKTIQSVLKQTYENIEYIIIDGDSTDNTLDIVRKYEGQIAYWQSEPDKGISDAFNKGISVSTGELVGIINSDDWYSENAIQAVVSEYLTTRNCILHGKLQYWEPGMKPIYIFSADDNMLKYCMTVNHPTVFVPKKVYEEIGLFQANLRIAMDYEILRRAKIMEKKFEFVDCVVANMQIGGISERKWLEGHREMTQIRIEQGMNFFKSYFIFVLLVTSSVTRRFLEKIGMVAIVGAYRKYISVQKKEINNPGNAKFFKRIKRPGR